MSQLARTPMTPIRIARKTRVEVRFNTNLKEAMKRSKARTKVWEANVQIAITAR